MDNDDKLLAKVLRQTQVESGAPPFATLFAAAESQVRMRRRVKFTAAGVAVVVALAAVNFQQAEQFDEFIYVDRDELAASTRWSAPSDTLLPTHEFDIYQEIPRLFESTEPDGGALL